MARLRDPDVTIDPPIRERDTPVLRAAVKDNSDPPIGIAGSALEKFNLTLYNERDLAIINGRNRVDARAFVDVNGALAFQFEQADMPILGTQTLENHRLLLEWEWNGGKRGSCEVRVPVSNEALVP